MDDDPNVGVNEELTHYLHKSTGKRLFIRDYTDITFQDTVTLAHSVGGNTLDFTFVEGVLSSTGPILHLEGLFAPGQHGYYGDLDWVAFAPAVHAMAAVRDRLYEQPDGVSRWLRGESVTEVIMGDQTWGATDILHKLDVGSGSGFPLTAHEVKRARVLEVDGMNVLERLVDLARQSGSEPHKESIDELINYRVTHIILSTQDQYALLYLSDSQQLRISRVYAVRESGSQLRDMTDLVLFYRHAALTHRSPYPALPSIPAHCVRIPYFSPRIFQPSEGLFCNGALIHRAKLSVLRQKSAQRPIPSPLNLHFYGYEGSSRHDDEVVVSFCRLVFWLFETRIVAKLAYQACASERLRREFEACTFLHALQGVAIPTLFGLYRNHEDGSAVLITS
ncbi:hypothetical protein B0H13DRAFT_2351826 [Mycena leptocephala]|nr:hypothetical protein B0H13DRAFT_2351826 [Mycena leptocephala]